MDNLFDQSFVDPSQEIDREMIKQLVSLRHIKEERESLLNANHNLINQLSKLEVQVMQQKVIIEAKELENAKLKTRVRRLQSEQTTSRSTEGDSRNTAPQETSDLKEELENERTLRLEFEQKYLDVLTAYTKNLRVTQLEDKVSKLYKELQTVTQERNQLKYEEVARLEDRIGKLTQEKLDLEIELVRARNGNNCPSSNSERSLPKSKNFKTQNEPLKVGKEKQVKLQRKAKMKPPRAKSLRTTPKETLVNNKPAMQAADDTFGDNFPDEDELE